jgi:4-hydroxy-3-polyprenylbenzoate decarboxylase
VQALVELKYDPVRARSGRSVPAGRADRAGGAAAAGLAAPILHGTTRIGELPQIVNWPRDGGPFITLPQVYTEDVGGPA